MKNLKQKLRPEDEHRRNSPWNTRESNENNGCLHTFDECTRDHREFTPYDIAAGFEVEMSLLEKDIAGMLREYEEDYRTGMDITGMAKWIYDETSEYPFLVSKLCKLTDEEISRKKVQKRLHVRWMIYYHGEIFVVEMKIWHGSKYHEAGKRQLLSYMDDYHQTTGYLITFNFNQKKNVGMKEVEQDGKIIIEAAI